MACQIHWQTIILEHIILQIMGLDNLRKKDAAKGKKPKSNILKVNKYESPQMALNLIAHIMTSATDTAVDDEFLPFYKYSDNLSQKFYDEVMKYGELVEAANDDSKDFIDTHKASLGDDLKFEIALDAPTELERTNGKSSRIIAVGGGFSSGKSSFLNSLTGIGNILPTGIEPVSMINTFLNCSNNTNKLIVKGRNIKKNLVLLDKEVLDCIQHSSKSKVYVATVLDTLYIDIPSAGSPNHIDGLTFVDTPGYNNSEAANVENSTTDRDTAVKALSSADAIIWCIDIEAGTITQRDIEVLNDAVGDKEDTSLLIVFTKMDKKPEGEVNDILERAAKTCEKSLVVQPVDIIACSCLGKVASAISFRAKRNGGQMSSVAFASIIDKLKKDMQPAKDFSYWQNSLYKYFDQTLTELDDKVKEFEKERQKLVDAKDSSFRNANDEKEYRKGLVETLENMLITNYDEILDAASQLQKDVVKVVDEWGNSFDRETEWSKKVGFFSNAADLTRQANKSYKKYERFLKKDPPDYQYWKLEDRKEMLNIVKAMCQDQEESDKSNKEDVLNAYNETVGGIKLLRKFKELVGKEKIESSQLLKSCYDHALKELKRINAHLEGIQQNGENDIFSSIAADNTEQFLNCFSKGVDLTVCNEQGFSPLTYIARCSNNTMMKFLINQDVDLTMKDKRGYNALETAAMYHCRDICEMLIDHDKSLVDESKPLAELAENDMFEKWIAKF